VGREGGQSTADLAFADERGFVHQLLVVDEEVVKAPAHLLSAIVSSGKILWRRGWDTPDDMEVDQKPCRRWK